MPVAIHWLKSKLEKILHLDADVHHGDGVEAGLDEDISVFTRSIHYNPQTLFPDTGYVNETGQGPGAGFCAYLPLPTRTDDDIFLGAFQQTAGPLIESLQPDVLVRQLGFDSHNRDPLAQMALADLT